MEGMAEWSDRPLGRVCPVLFADAVNDQGRESREPAGPRHDGCHGRGPPRHLGAAAERFGEFQDTWGRKNPVIVRLWENARAGFVPFLSSDVEIRTVIRPANAVESARR
jgi:transposase-like protein